MDDDLSFLESVIAENKKEYDESERSNKETAGQVVELYRKRMAIIEQIEDDCYNYT